LITGHTDIYGVADMVLVVTWSQLVNENWPTAWHSAESEEKPS